MDYIAKLTNEFKIQKKQVENTVALIDEGNTIPFIARYRKEVTGGLSDEVLREVSERLIYSGSFMPERIKYSRRLRNLRQRASTASILQQPTTRHIPIIARNMERQRTA